MRFKVLALSHTRIGVAALVLLTVLLHAGQPGQSSAHAQKDQKPAAADQPYSVTYDVTDLLTLQALKPLASKTGKIIDGLPTDILERMATIRWNEAKQFFGKQPAFSIRVENGNKLVIHASPNAHDYIKDLLATYRTWRDEIVEVECWLFEVDRKLYEQQIKNKLNQHPGSPAIFVDPATPDSHHLFTAGKLPRFNPFSAGLKAIKSGKATFQHGEQREILSWQTAVPYQRFKLIDGQTGRWDKVIAYSGFSFSVTPIFSPNWSTAQIKLTQKVTQLQGWTSERVYVPISNQQEKAVDFEVPILQDSTHTATFKALGGWPIIAEVAWRPDEQKTDRVLFLLFSARCSYAD